MLKRRLLSVPLVLLGSLLVLASAPVLLLLAWIGSFVPGWSTLHRAVGFILCLLALEIAGVLRLTWNLLTTRPGPERLEAAYLTQFWWARGLLICGAWLFNLRFYVAGEDALEGPSALVIARHASIGDNVLPLLFFGRARREPLRYILKKELTWLPSLDIGGHMLPNLFVDRSGADSDREIEAVGELIATAGPQESVMIYPEGTRFTREKHTELAAKPALEDQLARWPNLLPPRLGGVLKMLEVNPGKDIVGLCHAGFEGASTLGQLCNGSWFGATIRIQFWRIPYADIPADHRTFVFDFWSEMHDRLTAMSTDETGLSDSFSEKRL